MNYLKKVEKFHKLFKQNIAENPCISSKANLRLKLLKEELNELEKAINHNDLVEVADALADLQYVLSGTILEFGFKEKFDKIFKQVHDSNMSKACNDYIEVMQTQEFYVRKDGTESFVEESQGKYLVKRDDGKVLKSINYKPVKIEL